MRRRQQPGKRRGGFTLVETLVGTMLFTLILGGLTWITVDMSRMGSVVTTNATLQSQGRIALDRFVNDVHSSRQILNTYTAPDGAVYSSDTASAIVLAAPSYAADGTIATTVDGAGKTVPAHYDYIVYRLVAEAANSADGPYTLHRRVDAYPGSARPAFADAVIARNVQAASFTCLVDQPCLGNGVDTDFALKSEIDVTGLGQAVTVNGVPVVLAADTAQFLPPATGASADLGTLSFAAPPDNNAVIDALYPVDPSDPASQANVNSASMALTLAVNNAALGSSAPQTTVLTATADLRNH